MAVNFTEVEPASMLSASYYLPPADQSQRSFRDVLGRFSTGVVLVTAKSDHEYIGMAVNSFASVSLEPPLVLFCAAKTSGTWPALKQAGRFSITVLGESHQEVSGRFSKRGIDRFASRDWVETPAGHPTLPDSLGWIDAEITSVQSAGDHDLVLATALDWSSPTPGEPLVFFGGSYRKLAA